MLILTCDLCKSKQQENYQGFEISKIAGERESRLAICSGCWYKIVAPFLASNDVDPELLL